VLFDEAARYFRLSLSDRYLEQGDVVLAPVSVLHRAPPVAAVKGELAELPDLGIGRVAADLAVLPAMIVTHECSIDKDFNRRVEQLRRGQMSIEAAEREAAQDSTLDPFLAVAPIVPFEDAAPSSPVNLLRNEVLGYFPVAESLELGIDGGVVDLLRVSTIERRLVLDRLAMLTPEARAALRYALARFWVYRAPKLTFELEQAVNKRIRDVRLENGAQGLEVVLHLDDASELRLLQAPTGASGGGPERRWPEY
jgi:hypothetical protein